MTAAYLTEAEIIRELRLPAKVGRVKLAMWKLDPTFPAPEPATAGRRFWPLVEQWVMAHHMPPRRTIAELAAMMQGEENFDAFRQRRQARKTDKTKEPPVAWPDIQVPPIDVASNVVATIGPGGKRLPKDAAAPVAPERPDPSTA